MPENESSQLTQLHQEISEHFNLEEVRTLCLHLGIDYDNLGGEGKSDKIREMVLLMDRKGRWADLLAEVKAGKPQADRLQNLVPPPHIPYHPNQLFTGREKWLSQLHETLKHDQPVAVTQAIAGLGGVGKTQLALAYCYRHREEYDLIQWLRADDAVTLSAELAELAYRLGLARRSMTDQPALHGLALNWLHTTNQRWLLVYDNADAIQPNELRPFLPKLGHGACLITSRNPSWGTLAHTLRLSHFSDAEAVAFLLGQPELAAEAIASQPQREDALRLAKLLGHLPLALEHARAYVEQTGCTLADYADYFANERQALWADTPPPADYDRKTITTTWELAFTQAKQTPGAAALLNLCCFLAPDGIPLSLITNAKGETLPATSLPTRKLALDKAIAALRRYSLLERDGDTLALHRLVQTVARDQMLPELRQRWAEVAVNLLLQAWPYNQNDLATWECSGELLPHLLTAAGVAEKVGSQPERTSLILNQAGFYLHSRGAYMPALELFKRALTISEKYLGAEHSYVATLNNNFAALLQTMGEYEAARPYLERAIAIDEEALGPNHPDVAIDLTNLGQLLQSVGDYQAARPYMERALAIDEKALGPEHPDVARDLNNLAALLQAVGAYEAARPYMERALAIFEKNLGKEHPNVATLNNNLGQLLQAVGAYEAARPYMERALAIDEKALGPEHPNVAIRLNNLGTLLQDVGEYEAAQPCLERALAIFENKLGEDHPNTRIVRNNLAALLAEMAGKS